ncbi:hypothetical protein CSA37_02120 [Candidatus Fermentibacteria bacterium]|nr:MAG: hypothetical protein CSA37_02120 [Candidatus Fermentibacteria bacterium]
MRKLVILLFSAAVFQVAAQEDTGVSANASDSSSVVDAILEQAVSYLGVPYVWGGCDENGFDCSGLTYRVFNDNGIALPRTVTEIEEMGVYVDRDSMVPGDIMIFHNPTHAGIYLGNREFIHCSSWQDRGVVITSIDHSNYLRRYYASVRVIAEE